MQAAKERRRHAVAAWRMQRSDGASHMLFSCGRAVRSASSTSACRKYPRHVTALLMSMSRPDKKESRRSRRFGTLQRRTDSAEHADEAPRRAEHAVDAHGAPYHV